MPPKNAFIPQAPEAIRKSPRPSISSARKVHFQIERERRALEREKQQKENHKKKERQAEKRQEEF
jgi:hypothetical protein